jgi:hypothetical protein
MKTERYLHFIIIAMLIAIVFFQRECSRTPECPEATHSRTVVWNYDTNRYITSVPFAYPVEVLTPIEIPVIVDSFAIFEAYFKRYVYHRVLKDDALAYIRLIDTVSQNRFIGSTLEYINRKPTQIITNTTTLSNPVNKLFVGPAIGGSLNGSLSLGGSALLVTKRDNAYGITADPFNKSLMATTYWKISFRKNKNPGQNGSN